MADVIIVGGGLAGSLLAVALADLRPELDVRMIEAGEFPGGDHTWSFHASDVPDSAWKWLRPFVDYTWNQVEVIFPEYRRQLGVSYHTIRSESFGPKVRARLGDRCLVGRTATEVHPHRVTLDDGTQFMAGAVLDARGFLPHDPRYVAFQKFVGVDLVLETPHRLAGPIIMDASFEATNHQRDGYHFIYTLPFDEKTVLVEDTRYTAGDDLDVPVFRESIRRYASSRGWKIAEEKRVEIAALPIPLRRDYLAAGLVLDASVPCLGVRGGDFHPTTGYSFPDAVRVAETLRTVESVTTESILEALHAYRARMERPRKFFRLLNRMLFVAAPEKRYQILQKFYRLAEPLVNRFYSSQLSFLDEARILTGKPPMPVWEALSAIGERAVARA